MIGDATAFPVSMARGATFDPELEERIGDAIGAELRASGATYTGAVCMNLLRHPAWGRAQETYGEDPHHVGVMAAALTRGLQRHVMACMKHFALNSMENARFSVDVTVGERALHEVYLPHFERVAAEGVASVMSAYNSVNGEWCGENATLLTYDPPRRMGLGRIRHVRLRVRAARCGEVGRAPGSTSRCRSGSSGPLPSAMPSRVANSPIDLVDAAVGADRGDAAAVRPADRRRSRRSTSWAATAHRDLARATAVRSAVLLRNEGGAAPGRPSTTRTGRRARPARRPCAISATVVRAMSGRPSVVTALDGIRAVFGDDRVVHARDRRIDRRGADLAVVVVGYTKDDEGEYMGDVRHRNSSAPLVPADR